MLDTEEEGSPPGAALFEVYIKYFSGRACLDKDRWGLNRSQRMQLKVFICLMGLLLLGVLFIGKMAGNREEARVDPTPAPTPHIPVVEQYANVWVMEADQEGLTIFREGESERYPWGKEYFPETPLREQVADVVLTDGRVTSLEPMTDKINGKILSADSTSIEVEGYGRLPLAADYKGYRLYDSLEMCTVQDLFFGYSYTDLCLEKGEVCGVLMVKEEAMEYIRVLVKASNYDDIFHQEPVFTCDVDFTVVYGPEGSLKREDHGAGEEITLEAGSSYFESDRVKVIPSVLTGKVVLKNCSRSQGIPSYRGSMEFLRAQEGIVAVNEVLLEEYLYSVVPSEMPSRYPAEALKAQAVSARTYAYGHMEHAAYPQYGAHVDDSTSYQVYNNILEQESTTTAVKETYGQLLLTQEGDLAGAYYYSTSCGVGSDASVWKTAAAPTLTYLRAKSLSRRAMAQETALGSQGSPEGEIPATGGTLSGGGNAVDMGEALKDEAVFAAFISSRDEDDFEAEEGWYRWTYQAEELDKEHMLEVLQKRYAANSALVLTWKDGAYESCPVEELQDITDIYIEKRGSGGVADELVIEAGTQKIKVISEHNIRYVLNDGKSKVIRQDGSSVASPNLLPSGFFTITVGREDENVVKYALTGGGFGHGVGMSQNGAREMAASGYSAEEILLYFYEHCSIVNVYGS